MLRRQFSLDIKDNEYVERDYRSFYKTGNLYYFNVKVRESDLAIGVDIESYTNSLMSLCENKLLIIRREIESYIKDYPDFRTSLVPITPQPEAPEIIKRMSDAALLAEVGPMAAVAGAIAQMLGEWLLKQVKEVLVENGGDIYIKTKSERTIAVFAGRSIFSYRIGIKLRPEDRPIGICTSSGTVGPSLSFGQADAVVIKAISAQLADAVATAAGNLVKTSNDFVNAIGFVKHIPGILGILIIKEDQMAVWGDMEIVPARGENILKGQ